MDHDGLVTVHDGVIRLTPAGLEIAERTVREIRCVGEREYYSIDEWETALRFKDEAWSEDLLFDHITHDWSDAIHVPGATTSGLMRPSAQGPRLEKSAIASFPSA